MKIFSVRQTVLPALLVLSPVVFAADEQTMIVSAAPQVVSELDTPAAVSVVDGEEMRLATPRINLSESLTGVPGLQVQNRQNYAQDLHERCSFVKQIPKGLSLSQNNTTPF